MEIKVYFILISILASFVLLFNVGWSDEPITITGRVMKWEDGNLVANEDIRVEILSNGEPIASTTTTTNSNGMYDVILNADMKRGKLYSVNVSLIDGENSYVRNDFLLNV
ncbi:MAG: hypothetical protein ABEK17_00955 [Candidatus Aenigmatarchaeota archaeon]